MLLNSIQETMQSSSLMSFRTIIATCLLAQTLLLNCVLKGGAQLSSSNNNNHLQQQQSLLNSQSVMHHNNINNNQQQQQQNLTTNHHHNHHHHHQARPLDRPSLSNGLGPLNQNYQNQTSSLVSAAASPQSNNAKDSSSPGDWFLMGGGSDDDLMTNEGKNFASIADPGTQATGGNRNSTSTRRSSGGSGQKRKGAQGSSSSSSSSIKSSSSSSSSNRTIFDDEQSVDSSDSNEIFDDVEDAMSGTLKEPECAGNGRYYCTYKEEYPMKLVTEVTKYYKWPLEKLFRDLHAQIMPKLAQDSTGNLVCDSITRVVRPGWTRNTNDRWLVVINTENYHQYVTEVVCQYGSNSRCNFIPPCYYSSCQQRYNTQKLLVIDPQNPYRGPFLSEFLFPSCCVCYVPSASDSFQDKYRSSPATIYQRTLQQESANNLYPPQYRPVTMVEELQASSFLGQALGAGGGSQKLSGAASQATPIGKQGQLIQTGAGAEPLGPGEIRRAGEQYKLRASEQSQAEINLSPPPLLPTNRQQDGPTMTGNDLKDFPRL